MFQFIHSRLVNFVAKSNLPYIPFALSTISRIGCGRAIYTQRSRFKVKNMATSSTEHTIAIAYGEVRVEALVCNYGPLDWNTPRELYEDGVPAVCPAGTMRSTQYRALCRKCSLLWTHDYCPLLSLSHLFPLGPSYVSRSLYLLMASFVTMKWWDRFRERSNRLSCFVFKLRRLSLDYSMYYLIS